MAEITKIYRKNRGWRIGEANHLVEERSVQYPELNRLYPGAVNTLRFVTISDAEGICLYTRCYWLAQTGAIFPMNMQEAFQLGDFELSACGLIPITTPM